MLTVLIAEQRYIDAIREENSLFFEPFLENKDLAFCEWKAEGQTLAESVPGLQEAVGRCRQWRAVIIQKCSDEQKKKQNPYDEVDYSSVQSLQRPPVRPDGEWEDWAAKWKDYHEKLADCKRAVFKEALEYPLQQLSTWLCFRPADYVLEDVAEKKDASDWAMEMLGEQEHKPGAQLESMEREQYKYELRLKEMLRREFVSDRSINIVRPSEVYCICERITENGFFDPEPFWNVKSTNDYSEFVDRNMLFDRMRFMVFDVLPETHRNFRYDRLRFLYAVMVFAVNPVPGSAMQSRRLYVLDSENDETPLCILATSYEKKLSSTMDLIDNEVEKIRSEMPGELTDNEAKALFLVPADVPVMLDKNTDTDDLFAKQKFGLSSNCPEDELTAWNAVCVSSEKTLTDIVKQQDRTLRKSVGKVKVLSEVDGANISRLTSFQMDDIRDYTESAEDAMVRSIPPDFSDLSRYSVPSKEKADEVRKVIDRRMTRKTTIILGALCVVLYLICFLPLIIKNIVNPAAVTPAILLTAIMTGLIAVVLFVTLLFLRLPLKRSVREYNNQMTSNVNDIKKSLQNFSKYLSSACNVRRGNAILSYSEKNPDEYTKGIRIRKKHQEDIRKKRAILIEGYSDFIADKRYYDETMIQPYEYDFGMKTEYNYPAPFLAGDFRQVAFLESGNLVTVPSSFVKCITLRMEEIYEK